MEMLGCCGNRSFFEDEEIHHIIAQSDTAASTSAASFTALLGLPPGQAVQLLHSSLGPLPAVPQASVDRHLSGLGFHSDLDLFERAARLSVFSSGGSPEAAGSAISNSSGINLVTAAPTIKCEPFEAESVADHRNGNLAEAIHRSATPASDPIVDSVSQPIHKQAKRKEREKKVNNSDSKKKSKNGTKENSGDAEKLPYVHVRARRGQATDNHSLAERARREKINARMKLLQDLVPGCNKISGTALVLDEIIHHVQSLQRQVEFLSMRLAAVNPRIDFNLDSLLAAEHNSITENSLSSVIMPLTWPEMQYGGNKQYQQQWPFDPLNQPVWIREEDNPNIMAPDFSYDSGNSVSLRPNQVKMES